MDGLSRTRLIGVARLLGAKGTIATVVLAATPTHAGTSGSLRLAGHVPPRASIYLTSWSASSIVPQSAAATRFRLADFAVTANSKQFSISLVSANADASGQPMLVDPASGAAIPYFVVQQDSATAVKRSDTEHSLALASGLQALDVVLPANPTSLPGSYQDRLILVIKAR
jgi:hypothetical protein